MSITGRIQRGALQSVGRLPKFLVRKVAGDPVVIDGRTLDLHIQALGALAARAGGGDVSPTPAEMRQGMRALVAGADLPTADGVAVHDRTIPGPAGDLPVRIYHPPSTEGPAAAIVWFHQGGGVIGDLNTDHAFCSRLTADCGLVVVSVDYRLAPEHKFPAGVDDCLAAYQWVVDSADGLGIDATRVAVAGTSQGGSFSAIVCQERRRRGQPQPFAQILIYPGVDYEATGGSMDSCARCFPLNAEVLEQFAEHYLPDMSAASDVRASPARADDLWGLAPAIVVTAGFDPLRDQGDAYAEALRAAGSGVLHRCEDEMSHSFTVMAGVSAGARAAIVRLLDDVGALFSVD